MSREMTEILARVLAHKERRAVPLRETFTLTPDPIEVFAIAPIKMVSEEIVQAVAFGNPDKPPQVLTRWNPLSRASKDLEDLAAALNDYVQRMLSMDEMPRIWVPHSSALTVVELIGHRYRTNTKASAGLQKMGWQCRAFTEEAKFSGQQAVAVAADLLRSHVVTGQAPTKDAHLRALLAWFSPPAGSNPAEAADQLALIPASGVLVREADDEVERLRKEAKRGGKAGDRAKLIIENRLEEGALNEWDLLLQARSAFWSIPLDHSAGLAPLASKSKERLSFHLLNEYSPSKHPHALARELDQHEFALELSESAAVQGDTFSREIARRKGRVIKTVVISVYQPKRSQNPCRLTLQVLQPVIRARVGTQLSVIGTNITGKVQAIEEDTSGKTIMTLALTTGVRSNPSTGREFDWTDSDPTDFGWMKSDIYERMKSKNSPRVYGRGLKPKASKGPTADLLSVARSLRKGKK